MKVLVIPSWYPTGNDKLLGIYHKEYCSAISKNEIDVNMLFINRYGLGMIKRYLLSKRLEIDDEYTYKVYKYKMLDFSKINYDLQMKLYCKKLEKVFKKYIKINGIPDILHAEVTIPAGYATAKLGKKYNIPVLVTEHGSCFTQFFKDKNEVYGKYVLDNAQFSTVSNLMKEQISYLTKDCLILPNVVDTKIFNKSKKKKDDTLNIITVSAFRVGKGIENIILALKILIDDNKIKDIHLSIIGDGYLMNTYKEKAKELNIDKYITFYGQKTKEQISELLIGSDIFVIGSDYESFCIPGIEALASGLPIVSTKCHGPEEYLNNNTGELCKIKDPKSMVNAIYKVYNKLDKYDINCLKDTASKYSYENVSKIALEIYNKLIK